MLPWWALLISLFLWQPSRAADLVFSGNLERVGQHSISIKLPDRRVIDARLPNGSRLSAGKIAAQFKIGDPVQITCKSIRPVWEEGESRYQFLELTKIQPFERPPGLTHLFEFPTLPQSANASSPPNTAPADNQLEHARKVNLEYAANLPNFVADETARRYTSSAASPPWHYLDTIETQITIKGNRADREQIHHNGRPWKRPFQALPGFKWYGGFGTEIKPLFDLQCPTVMEADGPAEVRGKQLFKYRFSSPPDGCFRPFYFEYQRYNPARSGHIFIDVTGGNVIRLEEQAGGFPVEFEFAERNEEISWDYVKIGNASHLLPVAANFLVQYSSGDRWRVEVEYKNHRHFESSTNVTFH